MRYVLAILIMTAGFWFWMQPREGSIYTGGGGNTMADAEKAYYIQMFNYAMSHVHDGERYAWESYNSKGNIMPLKTYASKSKSLCRHYKETFIIGSHSGEQMGVACKRNGKNGWCMLKPGNPETCALENKNLALTFGDLNVGEVDTSGIDLGKIEVTIPTTDLDISLELPDLPGEKPDLIPEGRKEGQSSAEWLIQ